MTTRRLFLASIPASAILIGLGNARADSAPLSETDAAASALGYKADARKVDGKKYPTYVAGRQCDGCQLYTGKAGDAKGACGAFGGKAVRAKGWCLAWARKA